MFDELPCFNDFFVADEVVAVLDARRVERAVLIAEAGGGLAAIEVAASRPDLVQSLVLVNCYARAIRGDGYPYGHTPDLVESFLNRNLDPSDSWELDGSDDLTLIAPTMKGDARFREWWQRSSRRGASPASALALLTMTIYADVCDRLARIMAPTLVIHRAENQFVPVELGRYLAEHITGARYVELPGGDHSPWTKSGEL